jgi:type II secretion system (T2SS) protein M
MISKLGLSQRDRRTLAVGLCAVASLFTIARGVPALHSWEADRTAEAQSAGQQLAALRRGLRILSVLRDTLRSRQARVVALDSSLLFGASPSAIAADLASALEDLADDNALKVTAMQLRSDTVVRAGLARVEVRITGITDVTGLAGFLRAVEADATPLVVRDLSVSQPEPTAGDAKPEALRVDMLVASIGTVKSGKVEAQR